MRLRSQLTATSPKIWCGASAAAGSVLVARGDIRTSGCSRFDNDLAGHVRVQHTIVLDFTGRRECERERVIGIQSLRLEGEVLLGHQMRNVVLIDPFHCGARSNCDLRWREGEI